MATLDELTLMVNNLTIKYNSIVANSKTISELTPKVTIDETEVIPISGEESITVEQIVDLAKVSGTITTAYDFKIANYTLTENDSTIECTTNSFTITLPTSIGISGKIYYIKNTGSGTITIDANGTETIDNELTQTITQWDSIVLQSNGINWVII